MQREVISTCPVCEGRLEVTRLHCNTCGTTIEGAFDVGRFAHLNREQMALLESFLRARGNLRELEREMSVSYPTVRGRVEALLRVLGLGESGAPLVENSPAPAIDAARRRELLERLARHELTAEQVAAAMRGEPTNEPTTDQTPDGNPEEAQP
jgi:hypothetical protein